MSEPENPAAPSPRAFHYPIDLLREIANRGTRERILQGAAAALKQPGNADLKGIWRRSVRVDGFPRNPLLAPVAKLVPRLDRFLFDDVRPSRSLITLWKHANRLEGTVSEFLGRMGSDERMKRLLARPPRDWTTADVMPLAEAYSLSYPGFDQTDAAVALCDAVWRIAVDTALQKPKLLDHDDVPDEDEVHEIDEILAEVDNLLHGDAFALRHPPFARLVEHLKTLAPDAHEWAELPAFIAEAIRAKAEATARTEAVRAALLDRLASLSSRYPRATGWLERDLSFVSSGHLPATLDRIEPVAARLETQLANLEEAVLRQPVTYREDTEFRAVKDRLRTEITSLLDELQGLLSPEPPDDGGTVVGPSVAAPSEAMSAPATPIEAPERTRDEPETLSGRARPRESDAPTGKNEPTTALATQVEISTGAVSPMALAADSSSEARHSIEVADSREWTQAGESAELPRAGVSVAVRTPPSEEPLDRDPNRWKRLAWDLVERNDLAAAYWLVQSLVPHGIDVELHDGLLAASLGLEFLGLDGPDLVLELTRFAQTEPLSRADRVLAHGIGIWGLLVSPAAGFGRWLSEPSTVRPLQEVIDAVRQFGGPLHPEALLDATDAADREAAIGARVEEITDWFRRAERRTLKAVRATDVWRRLLRQDLTDVFAPILRDERQHATSIRTSLERWKDRRFVIDRMHEVDAALAGGWKSPLTGDPRDQIVHGVADVSALGLRWCELVQQGTTVNRQGIQQATVLRDRLQKSMPIAEGALAGLAADDSDGAMRAAARHVLRALAAVRSMVKLPPGATIDRGFDNELLWKLAGGRGLRAMLGARLLWLPEVRFVAADDAPPDDALPGIARALARSLDERRTLQHAFRGWLERHDFRFTEAIATALGNAPGAAGVEERLAREMEDARTALAADLLVTQSMIEQAAVDDILDEDQRARYSAVAGFDPNSILDFSVRRDALAEVRTAIDESRQHRARELKSEFDLLDRQLAQSANATAWAERRRFVLDHITRGDIRLVSECLDGMRAALEGRAQLPRWDPPESAPAPLEIFLANLGALSRLRAWPDADNCPEELKPLFAGTAGREEDAQVLWSAWITLKRRASETELRGAFERLFFGFGFQIGTEVDRVALAENYQDWVAARMRMRPRALAPAPQVGSWANGVYEVLCVWPRAGTDALRVRLQERSRQQQPLAVLYFGNLSELERRQARRVIGNRPILLIDESLALFMAMRGRDLEDLFACTLPYTAINPYGMAGRVPPELFRGRDRLLDSLRDRGGTCLLYGGRQLGKSALLHHVAEQLSNPQAQSYATVEEIQNVGSPVTGQAASSIWTVIRSALQPMPAFANRNLSGGPDQLARTIRETFERHRDLRVTIGLDEADRFLHADAAQGFTEVARLRSLMNVTERRFRVIFAGAHSVQRFQGIPNQPLAQLGPAGKVGPLESDAARRLILEPLASLGVRFADHSLSLRILSFTNYHPALIQFVCAEILNTLPANGPPFHVSALDIQRVFRQVEDRVRERFEWTLALDPRYQCIALAIISDQARRSKSYDRAYSAADVRDLVLSYWPGGFADIAHNDLRSTLDEMEGLNVLVRTADGLYRLRSPNVVRLLGSLDDIERRLLEFSDRPADVFDADRHRPLLNGRSGRFSALTQGQERLIVTPRSGVGMLIGSKALGIDLLADSLLRALLGGGPLDAADVPAKALTHIPADVMTGETLSSWLSEFVTEHLPTRGDIAVQIVEQNTGSLAERVDAAVKFFRQLRLKARQWLRVVFVLNPETAWQWGAVAAAVRERIDRGLAFSVGLDQWDRSALWNSVERDGLVATDSAKDAFLRVTGGWPVLVDAVLQRCWPRGELRTAVTAVENALATEPDPLRQAFVDGLGLRVAPHLEAMVQFVKQESRIRGDDTEQAVLFDMSGDEFVRALDYLLRMRILCEEKGYLRVDSVVARLIG